MPLFRTASLTPAGRLLSAGRQARWGRTRPMRPHLILAALALGLAFPSSALADRRGDHDQAREAFERGDILPVLRILEIARAEVPGEVLEVDLDFEDEGPEYDVEILANNGRVRTVKLNARTGAVLEVENDD